MGSWGAGLYQDDFASDLKSTLTTLLRLPLEAPELLALLREQAGAHLDPAEESAFWLVTADQFARKGVDSPTARSHALAVIDDGRNLAELQTLGMDPRLVEKRRAELAKLRLTLTDAAPAKKRTTLKKPQPLVMQPGEVLAFPVAGGKPQNPYMTKTPGWQQDGWGALVVVEAERAYGFLAWYRIVTAERSWATLPDLQAVLQEPTWRLPYPGTCSAQHFARLELTRLGQIALTDRWHQALEPNSLQGHRAAADDISLANRMHVGPLPGAQDTRVPRLPPEITRSAFQA